MAKMRFALIATICFLVVSAGWANGDPSSWDDDTTTEPPSTTSTTTRPTTTTTPSTTTTEATTTTTTEATTTTTTTTTEATTTTTTTTTTEPPPTTTTPRPKPPKAGIWTVVDEMTNITCIVVKLGATFIVPYMDTNSTLKNATLAIPSNATSNGTCLTLDGEHQAITLNWPSNPESTRINHFTLVFHKNESKSENDGSSKDQYDVAEMALTVHPDPVNFPDTLSNQVIEARIGNAAFHPTNLNNTYTCRSEEEVHLNETTGPRPVVARLRNVQMEAFRHKTDDSFSTASYCSADGPLTSDIVPIAVGCALAALVVIVLIAYLIGRRRARQRGYQSV